MDPKQYLIRIDDLESSMHVAKEDKRNERYLPPNYRSKEFATPT